MLERGSWRILGLADTGRHRRGQPRSTGPTAAYRHEHGIALSSVNRCPRCSCDLDGQPLCTRATTGGNACC